MNCKQIHPLLTPYLLQDLDAEQRATVDAHLATCESCRNALEALEPTLALLSEALSEPIVAGRLSVNRRERILHPGRTRQTLEWISAYRPRLAIAAGVVLVVGVLWSLVLPATMKSKRQALSIRPRSSRLDLGVINESLLVDELEDLSIQPTSRTVPMADYSVAVTVAEPKPVEDLEDLSEVVADESWDLEESTKRGFDMPAPRQSLLRRAVSGWRKGNDKSGRSAPEEEAPEPVAPMSVDFFARVEAPPPEPPPPPAIMEPASAPQPQLAAPAQEVSVQPAEFDTVAMVKSPLVMKGAYASRGSGTRGVAAARYGGRAGAEATGEMDPFGDDSDIVVSFSDGDELLSEEVDHLSEGLTRGEAPASGKAAKKKSEIASITSGTELPMLGDAPVLGRLFKAMPAKPKPAPVTSAPASTLRPAEEAPAAPAAGQSPHFNTVVNGLTATRPQPASKKDRVNHYYRWDASQTEGVDVAARKTRERRVSGSKREESLRRFKEGRLSEAENEKGKKPDTVDYLAKSSTGLYDSYDGGISSRTGSGKQLGDLPELGVMDPFGGGGRNQPADNESGVTFAGKGIALKDAREITADVSSITYDMDADGMPGAWEGELDGLDGNGLVSLSTIAGPVPPARLEGTPAPKIMVPLPIELDLETSADDLLALGGVLAPEGGEMPEEAEDLSENQQRNPTGKTRVEARGAMEARYESALAARRDQLKSELTQLEAGNPKLKVSGGKEIRDVGRLTIATSGVAAQALDEKPEADAGGGDSQELGERYKALQTQLDAIEGAELRWATKKLEAKKRHAEQERLADEEARKAEEKEQEARFKAFGVNPFITVADNAFSTFAIDVDTAAYTVGRNYMRQGQRPPAESVRTEEFVNFFDYAYKAPIHDTFKVYTEVAPSKFGRGMHLMKIGVKGRRLGREEQRQASLTFLIDTSGSMNQPDRLGLVQESLNMLVNELNPDDQVAIVQYDSHARLVLEHTPVSQKDAILKAMKQLQCGGSTNLEEGMHRAYGLAAANFIPKGENRVLLLSDGVANLGSGAAEDILAKVDQYRRQGITCSVFGFGMGTYDDTMLETLANKGDGAYAFIDSEAEAKRIFVDDLSATLNTIATDVKIQVEFDPTQVVRYRQLGYENRQLKKEDFRNDAIDAGEVGSGQSVTALYEVELAAPARPTPYNQTRHPGAGTLATVRVRYRRIDSGAVEEIDQRVRRREVLPRFEAAPPRFKLAAAVGEFAEILRGSPYAQGSKTEDVATVLRPVALDLSLDSHVQELMRMVEGADGLSRGR